MSKPFGFIVMYARYIRRCPQRVFPCSLQCKYSNFYIITEVGCADKKWDLNIGGDNGIIVVFERGNFLWTTLN